jgi:hypothetical protein
METASAEERLSTINAILSTAIFNITLGAVLVVAAASALGNAPSSPARLSRAWILMLPFPPLLALGQYIANNPGTLPWLFPFVNMAIVSAPSVVIAAVAEARYMRANRLAWPVSWREWSSAIVYGAIGATTVAALINTAYLFGAGALLISTVGDGPVSEFERGIEGLPGRWAIFFDLSLLSIVAPINEEIWKGLIVAFFFFRHGGAARCFLWGVLAGSGFNLLETFSNSIAVVSPDALGDEAIGSQWWFFALARCGTGAMHALATGVAALGFYGLFRGKRRFIGGLVAGMLLHATWNFVVYVVWGDAFITSAGPDSRTYDILGGIALSGMTVASIALLWAISGNLRDEGPAAIYRVLRMVPAGLPARRAARPWEVAMPDIRPGQPPSTGGSGPAGTLTASASGSTPNRSGVSHA